MSGGPLGDLVICGGDTDPTGWRWDLFSQAEHDEDAQSILLCPDADSSRGVEDSIDRLLPAWRGRIIATALRTRGASSIVCRTSTEAATVGKPYRARAPRAIAGGRRFAADPPRQRDLHGASLPQEPLGDYCAEPRPADLAPRAPDPPLLGRLPETFQPDHLVSAAGAGRWGGDCLSAGAAKGWRRHARSRRPPDHR